MGTGEWAEPRQGAGKTQRAGQLLHPHHLENQKSCHQPQDLQGELRILDVTPSDSSSRFLMPRDGGSRLRARRGRHSSVLPPTGEKFC
ncbi:hypothetical protein PAMP_003458 [Pampus punctatissimus]